MKSKSQIILASTLGKVSFEQGFSRIPAQNKELMNMLENRSIGTTPKGEAKTKDILNSFVSGWDEANIKN